MPAIVHDMRSAVPLPPAVYIDTSVLLGAYRGGSGCRVRRDLACARFLKGAVASSACAPWTSLLAIEEACWAPLREQLRQSAGGKLLSEFRKTDPQAYAAAYQSGRGAVDPLMEFLKHLGVEVRDPKVPSRRSASAHRAICFTVRGLMRCYGLEMFDLFHIALAKLDGTDAIATLDSGYLAVDGIEVYTCR